MRDRFDGCLNEHGASLTTWAVLRSTEHEDGLSQRELASRMSIESPTLVRHLDRLEDEGLVVRRRDAQDRRVVRVGLTPAGHRRYAELRDVAANVDSQLRSLLDDDEIATLERAPPIPSPDPGDQLRRDLGGEPLVARARPSGHRGSRPQAGGSPGVGPGAPGRPEHRGARDR
ncbi:MAG TPA: MarR family transcriptional regulator [Acidimicrobiia bacterium]